MKKIINYLIESHKFFVKETPKFIGRKGSKWRIRKTWTTEIHEQYYPLTISQKLYYPIAYLKFMFYSLKDANHT